MTVEAGAVRMRTLGAPKFVWRPRKVTFNAQQAWRAGKTSFTSTAAQI